MKPILIEGAMDEETMHLIGMLSEPETVPLGMWKCVQGKLDGTPVVILRTNQGMANAAASTALAIERFSTAAVLNQGTSGGHAPDLHRGTLVIGTRVCNMGAFRTPFAPCGAGIDATAFEPFGVEIAHRETGDGVKVQEFPADPMLLHTARQAAAAWPGMVAEGTILSADEWNNQLDRIAWLHERFGSCAEEMEGAAAAQICHTYGVPFLAVRVLSNTIVHDEAFDPSTGILCQDFVHTVVSCWQENENQKDAAR